MDTEQIALPSGVIAEFLQAVDSLLASEQRETWTSKYKNKMSFAERMAIGERYRKARISLEAMTCPDIGTPFDFHAHLLRQAEFSRNTFGPGRRTQGVSDHIRKELAEIAEAPDDLEEWIDVVILALDGAWRTGASPEQIIATLKAKQAKNEARTWPDWRTADPNKAIEHQKKQRVYISGPMTGMPEHNFPAFNAEAARLRALGYDVVNPAELNPESEKTWHDCLRKDLMELLTCDAIALLAGWQKSAGAHLEMHVAHRVGIEIVASADIQTPADAIAIAA